MKKDKNKMKITTDQLLTMERTARRQVDIELGITPFRHKAHKLATDYNRANNKKINLND